MTGCINIYMHLCIPLYLHMAANHKYLIKEYTHKLQLKVLAETNQKISMESEAETNRKV